MIKKNGIDEDFKSMNSEEQSKIIWKNQVNKRFLEFVAKTNGSYILETDNEISWNFENVSSEFAELQKNELRSLLLENV